MLPGVHAIEHAQLLLRRKVGEVLQPLPQQVLLPGWQPAKCGIILQRPFLLGRRHVFILAEPVTSMSLRLLRGMLLRTIRVLLRGWIMRLLRRGMRLWCWSALRRGSMLRWGRGRVMLKSSCSRQAGDRNRGRQGDRHQASRYVPPHLHVFSPLAPLLHRLVGILRIRNNILLQIEIVEKLKIGIDIVIFLQRLQITHRAARSLRPI